LSKAGGRIEVLVQPDAGNLPTAQCGESSPERNRDTAALSIVYLSVRRRCTRPKGGNFGGGFTKLGRVASTASEMAHVTTSYAYHHFRPKTRHAVPLAEKTSSLGLFAFAPGEESKCPIKHILCEVQSASFANRHHVFVRLQNFFV
jgi:hypothetical protein